ncbi:hypothetical protein E2C01_044090 [Portunus trituberculatus]|uniref:Uncharacterized protein n=1 Tax=Portunus trituberculatus TaxID=210409 RepID=A0A5B7FXW9_PORTR|nr:hypothetical protein [Portunus trituberculatus]
MIGGILWETQVINERKTERLRVTAKGKFVHYRRRVMYCPPAPKLPSQRPAIPFLSTQPPHPPTHSPTKPPPLIVLINSHIVHHSLVLWGYLHFSFFYSSYYLAFFIFTCVLVTAVLFYHYFLVFRV